MCRERGGIYTFMVLIVAASWCSRSWRSQRWGGSGHGEQIWGGGAATRAGFAAAGAVANGGGPRWWSRQSAWLTEVELLGVLGASLAALVVGVAEETPPEDPLLLLLCPPHRRRLRADAAPFVATPSHTSPSAGTCRSTTKASTRRPGGGRRGSKAARREDGATTRQEREAIRFDPKGHRGSTGSTPSRSVFFLGRPTSNRGPIWGAERVWRRFALHPSQD
jgi:hypothetical protein